MAAADPVVKRGMIVDLYKRVVDRGRQAGLPDGIRFEATYGCSHRRSPPSPRCWATGHQTVKTWIDDAAPVFAIPDRRGWWADRLRGHAHRRPTRAGVSSVRRRAATCCSAGRYLTAAIRVGTVGWPDPRRGRVPVAVTFRPWTRAGRDDRRRLRLPCGGGPGGRPRSPMSSPGSGGARRPPGRTGRSVVMSTASGTSRPRCRPSRRWSPRRGQRGIRRAALPHPRDVAVVRRRVNVRIAVDQSITEAAEPLRLPLARSADVPLCCPSGRWAVFAGVAGCQVRRGAVAWWRGTGKQHRHLPLGLA